MELLINIQDEGRRTRVRQQDERLNLKELVVDYNASTHVQLFILTVNKLTKRLKQTPERM